MLTHYASGSMGETLDNLERAHHYRDEAAHLRQMAASEGDREARECILAVAAKYDGLYDKYLALAMPARRSS